VRIELDFPPAELFPNRAKGTHWGKLYKLRSDYRENSTWLAKHQIKNWKHQGGNIKLTITFEMPDKRKRDADNCLAAAKGALDGLADALFVNDQLFQPILIYRQEGVKPGKLIVDIEELT
jgi:crossover junction endodeoxyribonuclease RusA